MQTSCVVANYLTAKSDDRDERIKTTTFDNDVDLDVDERITVNDSMLHKFDPDNSLPAGSSRCAAGEFHRRNP